MSSHRHVQLRNPSLEENRRAPGEILKMCGVVWYLKLLWLLGVVPWSGTGALRQGGAFSLVGTGSGGDHSDWHNGSASPSLKSVRAHMAN
jgi:hypothetical protein